MTALLVMVLGIAGVAYAVLPQLRGRQLPPLTDELADGYGEGWAEAEVAVLRSWSEAAGESRRDSAPPTPEATTTGDEK